MKRSISVCFCSYLPYFLLIIFFVFFFCAPSGIAKAELYTFQYSANPQGHPGLIRPNWFRKGNCERTEFKKNSGKCPIKSSEFQIIFNHPDIRKVTYVDNQSKKTFEYDRIDINDLPYMDKIPGEPLLPVRPFYFLVPYNSEVLSINIVKNSKVCVEGQYIVEPTQEPVPLSQISKAAHKLPDKLIYGSDDAYPLTTGGNEMRFVEMGGYTILVFSFCPLEYYPLSGKLFYFPKIKIRIDTITDPDSITTDGKQARVDPGAAQILSTLVNNPEDIETYKAVSDNAPEALTIESLLPLDGQYDYVIITSSALENGFQPLLDIKEGSGLSATVVTTEYIEENYKGIESGDKADKIRDFIRDAYNNWQTRWILLGGDVGIIPHRAAYANLGSFEFDLPTDMYYACLDGPWDYNRNSVWGECRDGINGEDIDMMPEVFIGRAPVSNITEVENFVAKTVLYSRVLHPNYSTFILLGEVLDKEKNLYGSESCTEIRKLYIPRRWNVTERYEKRSIWSGIDFLNDINENCHLVYHDGHSNIVSNAGIVGDMIENRVTNKYPYFMYSVGCWSGAFDYSDCIGETHVISKHGAFAVIMNSRYGYAYSLSPKPTLSFEYASSFYDAVFNENITRLGEANHDSKVENIWRVGNSGSYRQIHLETNLLGDPELALYLGRSANTKSLAEIKITQVSPASGTRETEVEIRGENFGNEGPPSSRVNFYHKEFEDGQDAIILRWRHNYIKCRVPGLPHGGYNIKVFTPDGDSNTENFTIL